MGLAPDSGVMRERPPAFIIHGGPGSDHTGFKPALSPLAERMQLVYFDHRGQGRSARGDPATYTLDENVEDMEALRLYLGTGPIVSIGTSYGGMVAMAHAARYPDAISHLVLVVTAAHNGFIGRSRQIVRERGTPEQQEVLDALYAGAAHRGSGAPLLRCHGAALLAEVRSDHGGRGARPCDARAGAAQSRLRAGRLHARLRPAAGAWRESRRRR